MIADGAQDRLWRLANRSTFELNDNTANLKITPQLRPSHCVTPTPSGRAVEARAGQGDRCPVSTSITGSYMPRRPGARVTVTNGNRHPSTVTPAHCYRSLADRRGGRPPPPLVCPLPATIRAIAPPPMPTRPHAPPAISAIGIRPRRRGPRPGRGGRLVEVIRARVGMGDH